MAIASVGTLGTAADSVSASSFALTTATNSLASGDQGILVIASDNISTADGATNDHTSVTGGTGTWTKLGEYTNSPGGVAADGVTVSLWVLNASGAVAIGSTITMNLSAAAVDKCATFHKFTVAAGKTLVLTTGTTNPISNEVNAANDFGSVSFTGLASVARLYFRALAKEANTSTAMTNTTGFTVITGIRSRNNAAAVIARGEFKIATSTGETSNPTLAVSGDTAGLFAALEEGTPPTPTITPGVGAITLAGIAPELRAILTPPAGALTLAGFAPSLVNVTLVTPGAGALSVQGFAPTLLTTVVLTPPAGAVSVQGFAPELRSILTPPAGALVAVGLAPSLRSILTPPVGAIGLAGIAPSLKAIITPPAGQLAVQGFQPALASIIPLVTGSGALTVVGYAPTLVTAVATRRRGRGGIKFVIDDDGAHPDKRFETPAPLRPAPEARPLPDLPPAPAQRAARALPRVTAVVPVDIEIDLSALDEDEAEEVLFILAHLL